MHAKRHSAPARAAIATAGMLLITTVAEVANAATPPPSAFAQIAADLGTLNGALGAIANAYGTLQAVQFVLALFGVGKDNSVEEAVQEITNVMQQYRNDSLLANVTGDMTEFAQISNGDDSLWPFFVDNCDQHIPALQLAIKNGNMTDAYTLAADYNLLTMTCVAGMKARGINDPTFPTDQAVLDSFLSQLLQTDYSLVGGITINMDVSCSQQSPSAVPGSNVFQWTQGGKTMWQKYAPNSGFCNLYRGCNTISTELSCCAVSNGKTLVSPPPNPDPERATLTSERQAFLADPAVQSVRTGMLGAAANLSPSQTIITDGSITYDINQSLPYCQGHLGF